MNTARELSTDERRTVRIECPNCHRHERHVADLDVAHCFYCGNVWDWKALRIVRLGGKG